MAKISVQGSEITVLSMESKDYISLTDIARYKSEDPAAVIGNWMRNRNTIEYLGIWETLYNSRSLKRRPDLMHLRFPLRNG